MATIKVKCSCGSEMETKGSDIHCGIEASKFLEAHEICRETVTRPPEAEGEKDPMDVKPKDRFLSF